MQAFIVLIFGVIVGTSLAKLHDYPSMREMERIVSDLDLALTQNEKMIPKTAFEAWLHMELWTQKEFLSQANMNFESTDAENKEYDVNQRLSDQVFLWYMELFPSLIGLPFIVLSEAAKKSRTMATIKALIKDDKDHDLAKQIKDKV